MYGRKNSFTLIELLVVVAIIGILSSLLLPSLATSRRAAFKAVCISNQKQVASFVELSTSDFDDYFPMASTQAYGPLSYDDLISGYARSGGLSTTQKNQRPLTKTADLDSYAAIYKCPEDRITRGQYARSYALNSGDNWSNKNSFTGISTEWGAAAKVGDVTRPSNTLMLGERFNSSNQLGTSNCAMTGSVLQHIGSARHLKGDFYVYAHVDGHVEYLHKQDLYQRRHREQ